MSQGTQHKLRGLLATQVRNRRVELGWSQEFLAERAELTQAYVSRIEGKSVAASIDVIEKLAAAFEVKADLLLKPKS